MSIEIVVLGGNDTEEAKEAALLRDSWKSSLRSGTGKIYLVPNAFLFGYRRREHDIVVIGSFEKPALIKNIKTRFSEEPNNAPTSKMDVFIHNFVFHIETKSHDISGIKFNGANASVRYREGWQRASSKSHQQKSDLLNYLNEHTGMKPFIANFLWFTSLKHEDFPDVPHNFLGGIPSIEQLIRSACDQCFPHKSSKAGYGNYYAYKKVDGFADRLSKALKLFDTSSIQTGGLTRKKVEKISKRDARQSSVLDIVGKKMVLLRGKAGTGKTMRLIHWSSVLAMEEARRCLILTYNKALVSDVRRLLTLAAVDRGIGADDMEVMTVHGWIHRLACSLGVYDPSTTDFLDNFDAIKKDILEYVKKAIADDGLDSLIEKYPEELSFDIVGIDEAQDWPDDEKAIVMSLVSPEKFVVADGVDQMVRRGIQKQKWRSPKKHHPVLLRTSLRQKSNIIAFVKSFAEELGYSWDVNKNRELPGGRIVVLDGDYTQSFHRKEFEKCKNSGNLAYEYLFLCPPKLVARNGERHFLLKDKFEDMDIRLWDGTNKKLRKNFPTNVDEHPVLQYDSCRGLEGWTVCCLGFDNLLDYKKQEFDKSEEDQLSLSDGLGLSSKEERSAMFVAQWATMPLTRAVDTLILQITESQSLARTILEKIADDSSSVIEWVKSS